VARIVCGHEVPHRVVTFEPPKLPMTTAPAPPAQLQPRPVPQSSSVRVVPQRVEPPKPARRIAPTLVSAEVSRLKRSETSMDGNGVWAPETREYSGSSEEAVEVDEHGQVVANDDEDDDEEDDDAEANTVGTNTNTHGADDASAAAAPAHAAGAAAAATAAGASEVDCAPALTRQARKHLARAPRSSAAAAAAAATEPAAAAAVGGAAQQDSTSVWSNDARGFFVQPRKQRTLKGGIFREVLASVGELEPHDDGSSTRTTLRHGVTQVGFQIPDTEK
jgi:hypothetical protein